MFKKDDLKSHIGDTMEINGKKFTLSFTMRGEIYKWMSDEYNIYTHINEIPDRPLNVEITKRNTNQLIGNDHAGIESDDYETYKRRTKLLAENIIRWHKLKSVASQLRNV